MISPDTLSDPQVRDYVVYLKQQKRLTRGTLSVTVSAIRFFYEKTCPKDLPSLKRTPPSSGGTRSKRDRQSKTDKNIAKSTKQADPDRLKELEPGSFRYPPSTSRRMGCGGKVLMNATIGNQPSISYSRTMNADDFE